MDGYMCAAHIGNMASSSFYRLLFLGTNSLTHSLAHSLPQSSTLLLRFLLLTFWAARLGSGGVGSTMHIHSGKTRLMERVSIIACRFHLSLHLFSAVMISRHSSMMYFLLCDNILVGFSSSFYAFSL